MSIFSFISHCFVPNGSGNHPMVSEVKGSKLVPVDSEDPISVGNQHVPAGSKEPSSLGIHKDGCHVAIKRMHEFKILRLHDEKLQKGRLRKFMNEVVMLTCLSHENLVQLYGCTSPQGRELLLVQEYTLPAGQTASALAYLHASNIIHHDVKTSNILLDRSLNAKVADFGFSRLIPHGVTHINTDPAGTLGYIGPVYYEHCHLSDKSDYHNLLPFWYDMPQDSLRAYNSIYRQPSNERLPSQVSSIV